MIIENEMVERGSILILIKERQILRVFNIAPINNYLNLESLQAYFTQFSFVFLNSPFVAALYFYPY